jgi:hypothetical protein
MAREGVSWFANATDAFHHILQLATARLDKKARAMVANSSLPNAARLLGRALAVTSYSHPLLILRSRICFALGWYDEARAEASRVLASRNSPRSTILESGMEDASAEAVLLMSQSEYAVGGNLSVLISQLQFCHLQSLGEHSNKFCNNKQPW